MNGATKIRELFATKKTIVAPGAHDMLTGKIIGKLGFDAVYMTGYGQSASHLGKPDVGLMTMSEMVMRAGNMVEAAGVPVIADADMFRRRMFGKPRHQHNITGNRHDELRTALDDYISYMNFKTSRPCKQFCII